MAAGPKHSAQRLFSQEFPPLVSTHKILPFSAGRAFKTKIESIRNSQFVWWKQLCIGDALAVQRQQPRGVTELTTTNPWRRNCPSCSLPKVAQHKHFRICSKAVAATIFMIPTTCWNPTFRRKEWPSWTSIGWCVRALHPWDIGPIWWSWGIWAPTTVCRSRKK